MAENQDMFENPDPGFGCENRISARSVSFLPFLENFTLDK